MPASLAYSMERVKSYESSALDEINSLLSGEPIGFVVSPNKRASSEVSLLQPSVAGPTTCYALLRNARRAISAVVRGPKKLMRAIRCSLARPVQAVRRAYTSRAVEAEFEWSSDDSDEESTSSSDDDDDDEDDDDDDGMDYRSPEQVAAEERWIAKNYRFDAMLRVEDAIHRRTQEHHDQLRQMGGVDKELRQIAGEISAQAINGPHARSSRWVPTSRNTLLQMDDRYPRHTRSNIKNLAFVVDPMSSQPSNNIPSLNHKCYSERPAPTERRQDPELTRIANDFRTFTLQENADRIKRNALLHCQQLAHMEQPLEHRIAGEF